MIEMMRNDQGQKERRRHTPLAPYYKSSPDKNFAISSTTVEFYKRKKIFYLLMS